MSQTWNSDEPPLMVAITPRGWVLVALRGLGLIVAFLILAVLIFLVRLVEAPVFGLRRPITPFLTQAAAYVCFFLLGLRFSSHGVPMAQHGAVVANHGSWLDIITLSARQQIYFVAKSEVSRWPGIGWLARATGTAFIARDRSEAGAQKALFESRLKAGHKLLFFPEGTSTDARRVLDFKPTLFAAFFDEALREEIWIQPVTVVYTAPRGQDPRFYGWWGDMGFGEHVLKVLSAWPQGKAEVTYHPPLAVRDFANRKVLAKAAEQVTRATLDASVNAPINPLP